MTTQATTTTDSRLALIVIRFREKENAARLEYDIRIDATGEKELSPVGRHIVTNLTTGIKSSIELMMEVLNKPAEENAAATQPTPAES